MNIKTTLFTLTIGSIVCFTAFPVQADAFRINRERFEDYKQQNQRNQDEDKDKKQRPAKEQPRREESRKEHQRRDGGNDRDGKRRVIRAPDRQPPARSDRDRPDRDRHDRPPVTRPDHRPSPGLFDKVKRKAKPVKRVKRPHHHIIHHRHNHREYRYVRGPWYYTRYINPFPYYYYPIGFRLHILPSPYVRIVVGGFPYFYYSGVFYQRYNSGYIVVSAPIGAFVTSLPEGFIAFTIGLATFYYINDTYYTWDEAREGYVVIDKPAGADEAMAKATLGRLMVYPNSGQSEEQQAKDRYECHRWAVSESGFDPTLEEEEYSAEDNDVYRRALAACLEGRDYTVK